MVDSSSLQSGAQLDGEAGGGRFLLWIDGVGSFLVCLSDRVVIGGASAEPPVADVALLARLSRRHATIERSGEGYVMYAHAPCAVAGRPVYETTHLSQDAEIELGESVRLRFHVPSVLSGSARLEFVSGHRPARSLDGVVLMEQTCLLGPGSENHVRCAQWPDSVVLFRRNDQLWCKSRGDFFVDGKHVVDSGRLSGDVIVTGPEFRFRMETVKESPARENGRPLMGGG